MTGVNSHIAYSTLSESSIVAYQYMGANTTYLVFEIFNMISQHHACNEGLALEEVSSILSPPPPPHHFPLEPFSGRTAVRKKN